MKINYKKDNRIIVDLGKCQFARFYYRNQSGTCRDTKPETDTYNNVTISAFELAHFHPNFPNETVIERFKRRGIIPDVWISEVCFKLSANHCLIYTGEKAVGLYKAWCEKVFNKDKKK